MKAIGFIWTNGRNDGAREEVKIYQVFGKYFPDEFNNPIIFCKRMNNIASQKEVLFLCLLPKLTY